MKDFFEVLQARRSVRSFLPKAPDQALLRQVLQAGTWAPTAGNMQPWEFIIVQRDQALKEAIVNTTYVGNSPKDGRPQRWILQAPVLIIVCCNLKRTAARYGWEAAQRLVYQDVSAAVENMLLTITALGLGSCWVGGFDINALKVLLQLPKHIEPMAILPVGYPAKVPSPPPRLSLDEIVRAVH